MFCPLLSRVDNNNNNNRYLCVLYTVYFGVLYVYECFRIRIVGRTHTIAVSTGMMMQMCSRRYGKSTNRSTFRTAMKYRNDGLFSAEVSVVSIHHLCILLKMPYPPQTWHTQRDWLAIMVKYVNCDGSS